MNENLLSIEKRSSINGTFWKKRFDYDYEVSYQSSSSKLNNFLDCSSFTKPDLFSETVFFV